MFELIVSSMLVTLTSYRSVPNQTDSTPYITSIGHRVSEEGMAVSQDLIRNKKVCYGDVVLIDSGIGYESRVVNDTMNKRHKNWVDIWVKTYEEEALIGLRKGQTVYVIQSETRCCRKPCK